MAKEPLKREKVTKYLGVLIDDKLSWKHHIQSVNTKLRKGIGILSNIKEYVTKGTLRTLYYSFIQPHLVYNILNWSSTPISNLQCLNASTKKAVRILLSKNKREHALPLFKELKILPLDDHIKLRKGLYMWKIHNHLIPPHLSNKFQSHNTVIMERLHYGRYRLPNPRLDYAKRHISYSGVKLWNSEIPDELKKLSFPKLFKKKYQNFLPVVDSGFQ